MSARQRAVGIAHATPGASASDPTRTSPNRWAHRLISALLIVAGLAFFSYAGLSTYIASKLAYATPEPLAGTVSQYGLTYTDIVFPARIDGLQIHGWLIPGVLPDGRLTLDRTLILVHGTQKNRTDSGVGLLPLSASIAHKGFAVLAFDMRGQGESQPAPLTMGYFEQRDVLGAVDFLRSGINPYPELGRARLIAGWGVSMGGATLLLAAAQEQAIRAVVSDAADADIIPIVQREIPARGHVPGLFTPGALVSTTVLYGMNLYAVRPVDIIARIAPRPILLIHGTVDDYVPTPNGNELYAAATSAPNAHVQLWLVPGAKHAQSYHVEGAAYVARVVAFLDASLGPDTSAH